MKRFANSAQYAFLLAISLLLMNSCTTPQPKEVVFSNPFLKAWSGPHGGVPDFNNMPLDSMKPALTLGMKLHLEEIDAIVSNTKAPTFENTIEPIEKAGEPLGRAFTYYGILSGNMSSPEFRVIQQEMAPIISEYSSKISQNKGLFERIRAVYGNSQKEALPADQQRVVQLFYEDFTMSGANLDDTAKVRYAAINKELSELYTKFSNNVLADEENYIMYVNHDQLAGLSESFISSTAENAKANGKEGKYALTNTRSVVEPVLTFADDRALREKVWLTYKSRGDNGDDKDNKTIIAQILKLRDERVGLLGYENYASWRLQDRMAKAPENAFNLMNAIWPAAVARVQEEVADMQAVADKMGQKIAIKPWDYLYFSEKVRKEKYDLDSDEVKQYLQLDKLREAMFFVAGEVFNFNFQPVPENTIPVYQEDVKVWEVTDKTTGEHIGLWYLDPYTRKGKRSGAWASAYRGHSTFDGDRTVLSSNNSNFIKPAPGEAVLVSWSDAATLFHEFGHALHTLCSNVSYPKLNGGVRDFTEFQSQLLERWLTTDEVTNKYLVHYESGQPMPQELVAKIKNAGTFNQGYETGEYLSSALLDMMYHTVNDPANIDIAAFEKEIMEKLSMPKEIALRHRSAHFSHIFSGEGYAAGYYGYIWADVLTADAAEVFAQAPGGFYDKDVSAKLVKYMFAPRNSMDPAEAYRLFRGKDAEIGALMRDRGFPVPESK